MHLQVRIIAATLLLAALAISTGTVLLLGYLLAAFSIGAIIFIMTRKMIRRIANVRFARVQVLTIVGRHLPPERRESAPRGVIGVLADFDARRRRVPLAALFREGDGVPGRPGRFTFGTGLGLRQGPPQLSENTLYAS